MPADYTNLPQVQDGYGIGQLTARELSDTVTIGGVEQKMQIDAATDVSWPSPFDGIIGMSHSDGGVAPSSYVNITKRQACTSNSDGQISCPSTSTANLRYTFMQLLVQDYTLTQPVFCLNLKYTSGGKVQFGDVDSTAYIGELYKNPAGTVQGWWYINNVTATADGVSHGGDVLFGM